MIKLSLRQIVKFWRKNKIWLKEENLHKLKDYGLQAYINRGENKSNAEPIWVSESINGKNNVTKITENFNKNYTCYYKGDEIYLFGSEGVFYKTKEMPLKKILSGDIFEGILVYGAIEVILVFGKGDEGDFIGTLDSGTITKRVKCDRFEEITGGWYYQKDKINQLDEEKISLIAQEGKKILYYHIEKHYIYQCNVFFRDRKSAIRLLEGGISQAYSSETGNGIIVFLKDYKIAECGEFDEIQILDGYYFVSKDLKSSTHILKYIREKGEVCNLGKVPRGKYELLRAICDARFYKMKDEEGMVLLCIYKNAVKYSRYKRAIDLKLSEVNVMENGNAIEIKPVAVFEKVMNN